MKIVIIQPRVSYYIGGGEKLPLKHAENLSKLGNDILILTTAASLKNQSFFYRNLKNKNIPNLQFKEFRIPRKFKHIYKIEPGQDKNRWDTESLIFAQLIYEFLVINKPDIIINYYLLDGLFKPAGIPNVLYLLGYPTDTLGIRKTFLSFYDAVISISSIVREKWESQLDAVKQNYILNPGVDPAGLTAAAINLKHKHNIVFAGRLIERKGAATLISSFKKVIKEIPDAHLWILGEGPQKIDLVAHARKMGLWKKISFPGLVKNITGYFKSADISVFPSHEKEGLMGTVLEAMSVGSSVITTTDNGNEDVIENGKSGILIKPKNEIQLANAIISLLKNKEKREYLGNNAKKIIIAKFSWDRKIKEFERLLKKIINHYK